MIKVSILETCVKCGACLECSIFEEKDNGTVVVKGNGVFGESEIKGIVDITDLCPTGSIRIDTVEKELTKEEVVKKLKAMEVYKCSLPDYSVVDFEQCKKTFDFSMNLNSGYEYSSDSSAESAGLQELRRGLFDRMDSIGAHILHDYQEQILQRILTYKKQEENYAYKLNRAVSAELHELRLGMEAIKGMRLNLPEDFEIVDVSPDFSKAQAKNNIYYSMLANLSETSLVKQMAENVESLQWYDSYINTDDMEVISGTDWRGNHKYKDKYAYSLGEAVMKIKEHYFAGAYPAIEECVTNLIKSDYFRGIYEPIETAVHSKARQLLDEIVKM